MHRAVEITVPADLSDALVEALRGIDGVVGLSRHAGASLMPPGDVVTVHALNRGTDDVMRATGTICGARPFTVVTAEVASISDRAHQARIDDDVDEAIWEELETGLRHQGRLSVNYLLLMMLGGVVAAVGAFVEPSIALVAYVASAIIAPGFEPIAKLPLGVVLRRMEVFRIGLLSTLVGYGALILAAAATWLALDTFATVSRSAFLDGDALKHTLEPTAELLTISAAGALAGIVIQTAYRRSVIAGPLVAMRLIEIAAVIGVALGLGRMDLVAKGFERLALDMLFVVVAGVVVFGAKQWLVHRRKPLH